jgi:putative ABC transport system substrate-binding protein
MMDRRTFIGGVAGGLLAVPLAARAQKPAMAVIGFLCSASPAQWASYVTAFRQGLDETGYVEGKNLAIEFRWAEGHYDRLPALAADLVRRRVAVLVATGGAGPVLAAKEATSTIPIVFTSGGDPVEFGLVASLSHPGGNVTGISIVSVDLVSKRLGLLHEMVPKATVIAYIANSNLAGTASETRKAQEAARSLGLQLHVLRANSEQEIDATFASLGQLRAGGVLVGTNAFFNARRDQFVALAARYAIPAMLEGRESVVAGGLMSYGASFPDVYRQAGVYTGKILNGAKSADLPVLQPTKFELVINAKTAKVLGLTIPQSLRVQGELIE